MQQDRLIGRGRRGPVRGVPRLGGPARIRQQPARREEPLRSGDVDRLDLSRNRSALRAIVRLDERQRRVLVVVTHLHHEVDGAAERDEQARQPARVARRRAARRRPRSSWATSTPTPRSRPRSGCVPPASARRFAEANGSEPAGDLAIGHPGARHGHRRRAGLPRLHLGPRRRPRRVGRAGVRSARIPTIRRSTRATTSGSSAQLELGPSEPVDRIVTASANPPPGASRRLARGPREHARRVRGRAGQSRLRRPRVRRPRRRRRRPRGLPRRDARTRPGPARARRRAAVRRRCSISACRRSRTCSGSQVVVRSSTSSSRSTPVRWSSRSSPPAAGRSSATRWSRRSIRRALAAVGPARADVASLAQHQRSWTRRRSRPRRRSAAAACRVEWHALDHGRRSSWRGRPASRSRHGPSAGDRRSTASSARASSRSASRPSALDG